LRFFEKTDLVAKLRCALIEFQINLPSATLFSDKTPFVCGLSLNTPMTRRLVVVGTSLSGDIFILVSEVTSFALL
jgi:hypothetical protein